MSKYGFDTPELLEEVIRISEENPDFIYKGYGNGCSYLGRSINDPTGQCCIVGQAFQNLGIPRETLESVEGMAVDEALLELEFDTTRLTNTSVWELVMVQNSQDSGLSWGESVKRRQDAS